jgi:hypothetical protein
MVHHQEPATTTAFVPPGTPDVSDLPTLEQQKLRLQVREHLIPQLILPTL